LLLGAGLLLGNVPSDRLRSFGATLSAYGAFALAGLAAAAATGEIGTVNPPAWAVECGFAGMILAFAAAAVGRRAGAIFAGISIALVLVVADIDLVLAVAAGRSWPATGEPWLVYTLWGKPPWFIYALEGELPWLAYAMELAAMLCLVVSGMLDDARPRAVAGWLGLAAVIASITWAVKGSLLGRSIFLAAAGAVAIALALVLGRLLPKESRP